MFDRGNHGSRVERISSRAPSVGRAHPELGNGNPFRLMSSAGAGKIQASTCTRTASWPLFRWERDEVKLPLLKWRLKRGVGLLGGALRVVLRL